MTLAESLDYLRHYGVPEDTIQQAIGMEVKPDLSRIVGVLDQLSTEFSVGQATIHRFLLQRYPKEFGLDVHHLLTRPGGVDEFCEFAEEVMIKNGAHFARRSS